MNKTIISIMLMVFLVVGVVSATQFKGPLYRKHNTGRQIVLNNQDNIGVSINNNRNCDPSHHVGKGAYSCFNGRKNVIAGTTRGGNIDNSCPSINPEFKQCVKDNGDDVMNKGRDFDTPFIYWKDWIPRPLKDNQFNPFYATFDWLNSKRLT